MKFENTPIDFESLPPAIRRKMFSSHERLRLALGQYQQKHSRAMSSSSNKLSSFHNSPDSSRAHSPYGKLKKPPPADAFVLSQADAQWFLNLPETIKRKHFTLEERVLLEGRCQSVIMDAADETIYRMGHQANKSCDTLDSSLSTISQRTTVEPPSPMDLFASKEMFDWRSSFRWLDEGDDLDLRLNLEEFHHCYLDKPLPPTPNSAHSRRRTLSLSAKPLSTPFCPPSQPLRTGRRHSNQFGSFSRSSLNQAPQRPSMQLEPEATYYRDPEARLKLRVYLASAQKFDEAVEFGFPASPEPRPSTAGAPRTFLFSDDSPLGDDESPPAWDGKLHFRQNSRTIGSPLISNLQKSQQMAGHYHLTSPGNREMTLRMTLTRPDLRADESQLYGWKKGRDPLALEPLPPANDVEPGMGPFDIPPWCRDPDPGLVKKIWRKVKSPITSWK
ncbi:hypothetical protein BDZ91DRAFT_771890 [Kalaharituber pfeilii]|nr:hypothetical protein BDZ91DRAFT_771890 [Kalaharituber pfeilii]